MYGSACRYVRVLGELLRRAVQQADVRIGALDDLAVELQHEPQHAVRRRVLRPEVHRVVADLSHAPVGACATGSGSHSVDSP